MYVGLHAPQLSHLLPHFFFILLSHNIATLCQNCFILYYLELISEYVEMKNCVLTHVIHIQKTSPVCLCIIILFGVKVCLNHMLMWG